MLADPTHALSKDFEVLIEEDGLSERGTFVVNPEGKIMWLMKSMLVMLVVMQTNY